MKFYRVTFYSAQDGYAGYEWSTSKRSAQRAAAKWIEAKGENDEDARSDIEEINIVPTRVGILEALRFHASHADNG